MPAMTAGMAGPGSPVRRGPGSRWPAPSAAFDAGCGCVANTGMGLILFVLLYRAATDPASLARKLLSPPSEPDDFLGWLLVVGATAFVVGWGVVWVGMVLLDTLGRIRGRPSRFTWWNWLAGATVVALALTLALVVVVLLVPS